MMYRPEYEEKKARKVRKIHFPAMPILVAVGTAIVACIFFAFKNNDTPKAIVEEVEIVEEELLHYILKAVKKDEMDADKLTEENVQLILDAEYEYSESLGVY